jgi:hypothetical protein
VGHFQRQGKAGPHRSPHAAGRTWNGLVPEPERLTREVLSIRRAPIQRHPEYQDDQHRPFNRDPRRGTDQRFRWSAYVWSPPPESNRRPHPYHGSDVQRRAIPRARRSRGTVSAAVMCSLQVAELRPRLREVVGGLGVPTGRAADGIPRRARHQSPSQAGRGGAGGLLIAPPRSATAPKPCLGSRDTVFTKARLAPSPRL